MQPSKALQPQRAKIREQGRPVRVKNRIDRQTSTELIRTVKKLGFTVTVLFEAAQILATFSRNDVEADNSPTAQVTLDLTMYVASRHGKSLTFAIVASH